MWGAGDHPFHGQRLKAQKIFPNLFTFIPIGQPKHVAMEKKPSLLAHLFGKSKVDRW
jgi:hypothetical protein